MSLKLKYSLDIGGVFRDGWVSIELVTGSLRHAEEEIHFTFAADCRVLEDDLVVFSVYGSRSSVEVSLLIRCNLNTDVNLFLDYDVGRLVVADFAVKRLEFRLAAVYALNIAAERVSFFIWVLSRAFLTEQVWYFGGCGVSREEWLRLFYYINGSANVTS